MARRREQVRIQENQATVAADGQRIERPVQLGTRWAEILSLSARERIVGQQLTADATHRVRLLSDPVTRAITPRHWLLLAGGKRLNIVRAMDPDRKHRKIELECVEVL